MAPARSSTRRSAHASQVPPSGQQDEDFISNKDLFIDPMLGTALAIYIEKDVEDKDLISQLIVVSYLRVDYPPETFYIPIMAAVPKKCNISRTCTVIYLWNVPCTCVLIDLQKHGGIVSAGYSGVSYILGQFYHAILILLDLDYLDSQSIPINHQDKIFIDSTQARRQKLFSTLSGFTNASRQTSCKPSMSTGLDVKSRAMKGDHSWLLSYSLLNPSVTVSISQAAHPGALRSPQAGQFRLFILKLCKLPYHMLNPCNHTHSKCMFPLCKGLLASRLPGRSQ